MKITRNNFLMWMACLTAVVGLLVCIGWIMDIRFLKSVHPGYTSMKFNTAIGFILTGFAFYLLIKQRTGTLFKSVCGTVFILSLLSLSQEVFNINLGIDQLLMVDQDATGAENPYPGRPSPITSICFLMLTSALYMAISGIEMRRRQSQVLFHLVSLVSFVALVGYINKVPHLYELSFFTSVAVHTALLFFVLGISAAMVQPKKGLAGLFAGNGIGNIMARNLFPKIVAIAVTLGYLRLIAYRNDWVSAEFGFALYTIAFILVGLLLIWNNAKALNIADEKRVAAELNKRDEKYRALIEHSIEVIGMTGASGEIIFLSPSAERMTGYTMEELKAKKITDSVHPEDLQHTIEFYEQLLREPNVQKHLVHRLKHKEGHYIWAEGTAVNLLHNENVRAVVSNFHEITERKKAEQELRDSELQYRSLFEQASDAIMITDLQGHFLDVNIALCKMFEYTKEELSNLNIRNLIDPEQLKNQPMRFDRLASGEHVFSERRMISKKGKIIDVEANVKMLFDGRVLAIARDITARKRAEKELQRSESRFRDIAERAPVAIACYRSSGEMIFLNSMFTQLTGYDITDLPDTGSWYNLAFPDKDYREIVYALAIKQLDDFRKRGIEESSVMEVKIHCKNGELKVLEVSRAIYEDRVYVIASDNTLRKKALVALAESELHLRTIFETEPECVKLLNNKCELIDINPAGLKTIDMDDIQSSKGMSFLQLVHERDRDAFIQLNREVFQGKSGTLQFEISSMKGTHRWMETHAVPMRDQRGNIISQLAISRDITERKKSEEEINRSHEELRQLSSYLECVREEERTYIAREIHDELGQQLTALKMDVSWLNKKTANADAAMKEKISDMISLIDGTVKTVRRISSELRPGILDDLGLLPALEWQSSEFEKRSGIECKISSKLSEMQINKNVATGLFRIYQEALTNIARHSDATRVWSVFNSENSGDLVLIINDNGKGFDSDEIKSKMTLGIAGMKERATLMKGEMVIGSLQSKGTTIMIKVPSAG